MNRPRWQIDADMARLKAERKAGSASRAFKPTEKRPRVKPEAKGQRQVRETDPGFLAYLRRQPCEARGFGPCSGRIEAAHVRYSDAAAGAINPGMQRKNHDRHANPLCNGHHQHDQHRRSERAFWERLGKDAYATAAAHYAAYQGAGT
ncbi:hypothetical protein [Brevundimonas sp.]|uniref:hypothetical protein n=1 Tax=Brevundimonas sp. TaxID=1871086 RepID=UPI002FC63E3A